VFLGGAMFCLLSSTTCHLFSCISPHCSYLLLRLDYTGIALLIAGSFYPPVLESFPLHKPYNCKKWLLESNAVFPSSFLWRSVSYVNSMVDELSTNLCHMQGVICQVIGCCVDRSTCNHKRVEIILGDLAMWCYNIGKKFMLSTCSMGNRAMTTCAPHGFQ
jgi:hypothetical protein